MNERTFPMGRLFALRDHLGSASAVRQRVVEGALGHVLEIGGDSSANLFLYPRTITSLTSLVSARRVPTPVARQATRQLTFPVDRRVGSLDAFPLKDHAYDTVVSTFALGAVDSIARTLDEVRRVLKPGGRLLFVEYGRSREAGIARWQVRLAPLHRLLGGSRPALHLIDEEIVSAGLVLKHLENEYLARLPRALGCIYEGIAFNGE